MLASRVGKSLGKNWVTDKKMKVKGSWNWILLECQLKERIKNKRGREDGEIVCCMLTSYRWSTCLATIQICNSFEWAVPMTHPWPYSCCMSPWSCDYDSGTWCLAHDYDIAVSHHHLGPSLPNSNKQKQWGNQQEITNSHHVTSFLNNSMGFA